MARISREDQERQNTTSHKGERPSNVLFNKTPGNIDLDEVPEGMRYCWITKSCRDVNMSENVHQAFNMGYRPVPKSRHPRMNLADDLMNHLNKGAQKNDYIEQREHILMEIPVEEFNKIQSMERERFHQQSTVVKNAQNPPEHAHIVDRI